MREKRCKHQQIRIKTDADTLYDDKERRGAKGEDERGKEEGGGKVGGWDEGEVDKYTKQGDTTQNM